jgi:hypothetical protein
MPNYLLAFHGGGLPETEEARGQVMAAWGNWFQDLGPALVDGGNPIGHTITIEPSGSVIDGGGANPVAGYTIIKADDLDAAVRLAKRCPLLQSGGSIEVGETFSAM